MQNINLYQAERRRSAGPQRVHILGGLCLLLALCLAHGVWQFWLASQAEQRLTQVESAAQEQEAQLEAMKAVFVESQLDTSLPGELAANEAGNRQLQHLLSYLRVLADRQNTGFVAPLAALAEHHPQGRLWLNGIHLAEGGTQLRLQGRSQGQELLPHYLDALGRSPVFEGREFARLDVQRGEDKLLDFDLSSRSADWEKSDE